MRRSVLITLVVLGSLITLVGSTGLFAALTDTANTGENSVDSGALAASADIQLATATVDQNSGEYTCGLFSDDLTTAFFTTSGAAGSYVYDDALPGSISPEFPFCLANIGSQSIDLSAMVIELSDLDPACTGDEAANGDTTCGAPDAAGELAQVLSVNYAVRGCGDSSPVASSASPLDWPTPLDLGVTLLPTQFACFVVTISYPDATSDTLEQVAQSDAVTWRFQFIGAVTP